MNKVRIGIVGLGNIGQIHAKSLLDAWLGEDALVRF